MNRDCKRKTNKKNQPHSGEWNGFSVEEISVNIPLRGRSHLKPSPKSAAKTDILLQISVWILSVSGFYSSPIDLVMQ